MTGRVVGGWSRAGAAGPLLATRVVGLMAGLVAVLLSARLFGPEGRGVLAAFAVLQFIGATGMAFGTGSGAFLGTHRGTVTAREASQGLLAFGMGLGLVTSGLAAIASLVGIWSVAVPGTSLAVALALGPAIVGLYLILGATQVSMGIGATSRTATGLLLGPIIQLGSVGVAGAADLGVSGLLLFQAAAWAVVGVAFIVAIGGRAVPSIAACGAILRLGRGATLGDLTNALSYRLDMLLVVLIAGSAAAGVYSVATQFLEPLWLLASSVAGGLLIGSRGKEAHFRTADAAAAAWRVALLTSAGAAVVVVALPVASSLAGVGFEDVPIVGALLAPGIVLLGVAKVLAAHQTSLGRLWLGSAIATAALVIAIVGGLILIPAWGAAGAAVAASISYGLACGLWLVAFRGTRDHRPVTTPQEARGA